MQARLKRIGTISFWLAIIIETVIVMVDKSAYINPYEGMLFRLTFLLCCMKIVTTEYSKKQWMCMIIVGVIAMISYLINTRDEVVRAVALIAACKDVDIKKVLKVVLAITAVGSILLFGLAATGVLGSMTVTANFGRGPSPGIVETRYCFGMGHPNAFQCMMLMMSILLLYLYAERMKWYHFVLLFVANFVAYSYTDSNTGILVVSAVLLGTMLLRYNTFLRNWKMTYFASALLVLAVVILSIYGAYVGRETTFMHDLDYLLNGRFQSAYAVENARLENWTLFADAVNTEYFDSGFIRLFYWYGIIPALLYIVANLYLLYQSWNSKDYTLCVIIVGLSVFMLMEAHLISVYLLRNYIFLWLGFYWYQPLEDKVGKDCNG